MLKTMQAYLVQHLTARLVIPILSTYADTFPCGQVNDLMMHHVDGTCYESNFLLTIMSRTASNLECLELLSRLFEQKSIEKLHGTISSATTSNHMLLHKNICEERHIHDSYQQIEFTELSPLYMQEWKITQDLDIWQAKVSIRCYYISKA